MNTFLSSDFSSFKIVIFLTIVAIIVLAYYSAIYKKNIFHILFSELSQRDTILYITSLIISFICYVFFTIYIYKKPENKTSVVGQPMESEGQFFYLIAYSVLLLSCILFIPYVFHYATSTKSLDISYIIQALSYLILFAVIGIILLFNNTEFSLKTKKEKITYFLVWVSLFYFFIQVSFLDIGFWIPKFLK